MPSINDIEIFIQFEFESKLYFDNPFMYLLYLKKLNELITEPNRR